MIDGYKILHLPVNIAELLNNSLLLFPFQYNDRDGGEIENQTRVSEYRGQAFILKNNNVKLKGSFHKYHNNGEHNYNDFYFTDLKNVIFDFCSKFNINPEITELNNLEFGVNIYIPIPPEEFLKSVINYKGTPFHNFNITGANGIECIKDNFIIKIYDKGHQYNQTGNLLRFEIKVISMQYFKDNEVKIKTISDLLNITELFKLKGILRRVFDTILIYDYSIKETKLNERERDILFNGRNPKYWENLLPKTKDFKNGNKDIQYKRQRKKYYRELDNFKELLKKYSTSTIQKNISDLIEKKCIELLNTDNETGDKLTDISNNPKTTPKGQINILNIVRICPVTELNISMQKPGSKFLCIAGIRNYYQNEKEIYLQLEKRLSQKWRSEPIETQFREIAHSIRNEFFNKTNNPRNNSKKSIYKVNENSLFDSLPYILPEKLIHAGITA